jgi:hypothetical protein
MLLATTQVEDFDQFHEIFTTTGAEKRKQHGSKGALIFRDRTTSANGPTLAHRGGPKGAQGIHHAVHEERTRLDGYLRHHP